MKGKQGKCVICGRTTYNSNSGLCRSHWEEKAWSKEKEHLRIYPDGSNEGELLDTTKIR